MNLKNLSGTVQGYLAAGGNSPSDIDPTTGKGPEWGKAAPIGLLVIVLLCVAVYFLIKSMNRNIKKVPESFVTAGVPGSAAGPVESGQGGVASSLIATDGPGVLTDPPAAGPDTDPVPPAQAR